MLNSKIDELISILEAFVRVNEELFSLTLSYFNGYYSRIWISRFSIIE